VQHKCSILPTYLLPLTLSDLNVRPPAISSALSSPVARIPVFSCQIGELLGHQYLNAPGHLLCILVSQLARSLVVEKGSATARSQATSVLSSDREMFPRLNLVARQCTEHFTLFFIDP